VENKLLARLPYPDNEVTLSAPIKTVTGPSVAARMTIEKSESEFRVIDATDPLVTVTSLASNVFGSMGSVNRARTVNVEFNTGLESVDVNVTPISSLEMTPVPWPSLIRA
jgi:hypothetical protein